MVFEGSGEVQPGIEEACNSWVVFYIELDDCWPTEDRWVGLMTEFFNGGGTGITGDGNPFLFDLLSFLLKHRLSRGVLCENLDDCWLTEDSRGVLMTESLNGGGTGITVDGNFFLFGLVSLLLNHRLSQGVLREELEDCWRTEDSWYGLMSELFNGGETYITVNDNLFLFKLQSLRLKYRLSQEVVCCLPWFSPVPLLWQLPIPLKCGMMNEIWVCGKIVCLLFCFLMAIKRWEPTFWRNNCGHVWVSVPRIKIDYKLFVSISS